ncbi:IS66 family transposase zinc-finger binding domain-containing protein [Microbispora sp. CA-135349]|uniref:IS66 family transposase zinc-finger binding domain-containing protein n=1 Tax=Microbispora sp. CA-135349 TaxID=3239953 RepID=UPI003D8FEFFA
MRWPGARSPTRSPIVAPAACDGCGQALADLRGQVAERVQVFDTPPVKLQVSEYRMVKVPCPACRRFPPRPDGTHGP